LTPSPSSSPFPTLFGGLLAALGVTLIFAAQATAWILLWPGIAFLLVGGAYVVRAPRVFGKKPGGDLSLGSVFLLFPYLVLVWGGWHVLRKRRTRPPWHEITPGLLLGQRLFSHEMPRDISLVIDLTSEFIEPACLRRAGQYVAVPTLDACAPDPVTLDAIARRIAAHEGRVYVHCASGHGRSATVVAAVLLLRGTVTNGEEAERLLRAIRPGVNLSREQHSILERWRSDQLALEPSGIRQEGG
jgi:protein-tyrosine phosphatase